MPYRDLRDDMNDVLDGLGVKRSFVMGEGGYYGAWLPDQNREDLRTEYVGLMYRSEVGSRREVHDKLLEFATTYFLAGSPASIATNSEGFPILYIDLKTLVHLKRLVGERRALAVARVTGPTTTTPVVSLMDDERIATAFAEAFETGMGAADALAEDCAKDLRKLREDMMTLRKTFRAEALLTKVFAELLALAEEWEGKE